MCLTLFDTMRCVNVQHQFHSKSLKYVHQWSDSHLFIWWTSSCIQIKFCNILTKCLPMSLSSISNGIFLLYMLCNCFFVCGIIAFKKYTSSLWLIVFLFPFAFVLLKLIVTYSHIDWRSQARPRKTIYQNGCIFGKVPKGWGGHF